MKIFTKHLRRTSSLLIMMIAAIGFLVYEGIFTPFNLRSKSHLRHRISETSLAAELPKVSKEFVMPSLLVVLDSTNGLCNQMGDFHYGINFCLYYNISFTVRHAAFRNDNLISWYPVPFTTLFMDSFLNTFPNYVNYSYVRKFMNKTNSVNFLGNISAHHLLQKDLPLLQQIQKFNKQYVVLTQCLLICIAPRPSVSIYPLLRPSSYLLSQYQQMRDSIFLPRERYNYLHYRHESDFTTYFNVSMKQLDIIINQSLYRDSSLKVYVATTGIEKLINTTTYSNKIVYKNESTLQLLNFEQKAMIDLLFGFHAQEVIGHRNSCFSNLVNNYHGTKNFYAR